MRLERSVVLLAIVLGVVAAWSLRDCRAMGVLSPVTMVSNDRYCVPR